MDALRVLKDKRGAGRALHRLQQRLNANILRYTVQAH